MLTAEPSVDVNANYNNDDVPLQQVMGVVNSTLVQEFKQRYPEMSIEVAGEQQEVQKFTASLTRLGLFAILVIYGLLAVQFKSMLQPLLIITAIPFSMAGVVWAHLATGQNLSLMSVLGMLAAAGVVVNDTLVLIDHTNHNRKKGLSLTYTLVTSAKNRFRPIFLTSLTTFMGLVPIMLETSTQAKFLIPMATSLAFGIVSATVVTLLLIPCLYSLGFDIKRNTKPFLLKHMGLGWHGEQKLWICFTAYYFIGLVIVIVSATPFVGIVYGILQFMSIPDVLSNFLARLALFTFGGLFLLWALTSTWRCAVNVKNEIWVPIIRTYVISAWAFFFYVMLMVMLPKIMAPYDIGLLG